MGNNPQQNLQNPQNSIIIQRLNSTPVAVQLITNSLQPTESQRKQLQQMAPILKIKYLDILTKLNKYDIDTRQLEIVLGAKSVKLGRNFIGRVREKQHTKEIIGPAIYFSKMGLNWEIFIGYFHDKKPKGKGIKVQTNNLNSQNMKITYLDNWEQQTETKGCYYQKLENKKQIVYVGTYNKDKTMKQGNYQESTDGALTTRYTGTFKDNVPHSMIKYAEIYMPGKFRYRGFIQQGQRSGFGVEEDLAKKVKYFGQFLENKKHGYGQLIYSGQKQIVFKGFWKNGVVQTHKQKSMNSKKVNERAHGVFYDHNGDLIQQFNLRFY